MKSSTGFIVHTEHPPTVELDSEAHAAYVRFRDSNVQRTRVLHGEKVLVTADLDGEQNVVGIEFLGVKEFGIRELMQVANIQGVSEELLDLAKYVPAKTGLRAA